MIGKRVGDPCPHCTNAVLLKRRDYFGGFYVWCIMCNRRWVLNDSPADSSASALIPNSMNIQGKVSAR